MRCRMRYRMRYTKQAIWHAIWHAISRGYSTRYPLRFAWVFLPFPLDIARVTLRRESTTKRIIIEQMRGRPQERPPTPGRVRRQGPSTELPDTIPSFLQTAHCVPSPPRLSRERSLEYQPVDGGEEVGRTEWSLRPRCLGHRRQCRKHLCKQVREAGGSTSLAQIH